MVLVFKVLLRPTRQVLRPDYRRLHRPRQRAGVRHEVTTENVPSGLEQQVETDHHENPGLTCPVPGWRVGFAHEKQPIPDQTQRDLMASPFDRMFGMSSELFGVLEKLPAIARNTEAIDPAVSSRQAATASGSEVERPMRPSGVSPTTVFATVFLFESLGRESRNTFFHAEATCLGSDPLV